MSKTPYLAKGMAVKKMKPPSTPVSFSEESSEEGEPEDNDETMMEENGQKFPSQSSQVFVLPEDSALVIDPESSEGEIQDAPSSQLTIQDSQLTEEIYDPSQDMFHGRQTTEDSKKKRRRKTAVVILPEKVEKKLGE